MRLLSSPSVGHFGAALYQAHSDAIISSIRKITGQTELFFQQNLLQTSKISLNELDFAAVRNQFLERPSQEFLSSGTCLGNTVALADQILQTGRPLTFQELVSFEREEQYAIASLTNQIFYTRVLNSYLPYIEYHRSISPRQGHPVLAVEDFSIYQSDIQRMHRWHLFEAWDEIPQIPRIKKILASCLEPQDFGAENKQDLLKLLELPDEEFSNIFLSALARRFNPLDLLEKADRLSAVNTIRTHFSNIALENLESFFVQQSIPVKSGFIWLACYPPLGRSDEGHALLIQVNREKEEFIYHNSNKIDLFYSWDECVAHMKQELQEDELTCISIDNFIFN